MSDQHPKDKAEDGVKKGITKTAEYRRFHKLLKQIIKAPPLRKRKSSAL